MHGNQKASVPSSKPAEVITISAKEKALLDKLRRQDEDRKAYRRERNQRPDVKAKNKEYRRNRYRNLQAANGELKDLLAQKELELEMLRKIAAETKKV